MVKVWRLVVFSLLIRISGLHFTRLNRSSMSDSACWTQLRITRRRDRRTLADLPLEKTVQMMRTSVALFLKQQARLSGNDHLRAEERFASALQEASKADIRSTNGQCVGGAEIWPQPMSMADIDLQSYVFWHTACISGGMLRFPKSKLP